MKKSSILIFTTILLLAVSLAAPCRIRAAELQETAQQETMQQTEEQPAAEQQETKQAETDPAAEEPSAEQTETETEPASAEPGKVGKLKLDNSELRQITVTWKKVDGAAGYQVFYSYDKAFKKYKKTYVKQNKAVLKKLKVRKKCYVKVRAYKGSKKKPVYGEFSAVRKKKVTGKLIVIDAGHQRHANTSKEPIGPGARKTRKKVSAGTRGVATKLYEYELNLIVAKKLQKVLEANGYQVVMIRTKHNVNIPNSERAAIANELKADAFIRIHANGSGSRGKRGTFTISPTKKSPYPIRKLYKKCYRLSKCVVNEVCKQTKSKNRGIMQADDYTGINWCKVPVTLIEMGYMSNPTEDRLMAKDSYQDKIVQGILNGFDKYFKIKRK